ncbi:uncharacterized protein LOC141618957 [Silene latifolia]|uniref:uncharacterized protein LOC141618957 n=1 Tax=Silene latifolia TaxID=37657 RepID=UPI003D76B4D5
MVIFDAEKFKNLDYKHRTTQHRVAAGMNVSQSTVARWVATKVIKSHTNTLKPDQGNLIHMDEKWFYITKDGQRPQYDANNQCIFDAKIGIWPFVTLEPAQINSKNRVAGTLVTKPIESVTKQVIKNMLLEKVLPEIKRKWPENASKTIYIQQDIARPHIKNSDADFREATTSDGRNIQLVQQPPNSPDMNVLDLGFFRAIQSLQTLTNSYKLDEPVEAVTLYFNNLEVVKLNYVYISMQGCMLEVLKRRGHNDYKIPHMHKTKLAKAGLLPQYLEADVDLVKDNIRYINNVESVEVANAGNGYSITDFIDMCA